MRMNSISSWRARSKSIVCIVYMSAPAQRSAGALIFKNTNRIISGTPSAENKQIVIA